LSLSGRVGGGISGFSRLMSETPLARTPRISTTIGKELFTRIISDISLAISQLIPRGVLLQCKARSLLFFSPLFNDPECAAAVPRNRIIRETLYRISRKTLILPDHDPPPQRVLKICSLLCPPLNPLTRLW